MNFDFNKSYVEKFPEDSPYYEMEVQKVKERYRIGEFVTLIEENIGICEITKVEGLMVTIHTPLDGDLTFDAGYYSPLRFFSDLYPNYTKAEIVEKLRSNGANIDDNGTPI